LLSLYKGLGIFLPHRFQTESAAHPAYRLGIGGSFLGCKAAGSWSWPLSSQCWG